MSNSRRFSTWALGVVLALSSLSATAQWVEQGPGPTLNGQVEGIPNRPVSGAINAMAVDRTNPGTIYLGTVNGGIWRSTNANTDAPAWTPLTDQQLPSLAVNSIAISPLNANVIFAGTGTTSSFFDNLPGIGVARSIDGGTTWTVLAGATFNGAAINSIVPTSQSSNGVDGQVVLAATLAAGVYRSTDGAATFTLVSGSGGLPSGGASSLVDDPGTANRLYAALPGNGVYRSDDNGLNWTAVNTGLAGTATSLRILLSVGRNTGVVYAMVIGNNRKLSGVFRSADAGANWTAMGVPTPEIYPGSQGNIHGAIVADPTDPNIVYVGGDRQAPGVLPFPFPNQNGCTDFSANTFRGDASLPAPWLPVVCLFALGSSPHADARDMDFDTNGNLLQANDGGFNRLVQPNLLTRRWVSLNANIRPTELHSVAYDAGSQIVFGGSQDTGTPMQNAPNSLTWTDFQTGDGGVVAVDDTSVPFGLLTFRFTSNDMLGNFYRSLWAPGNTFLTRVLVGLRITSGAGTGQTLRQFDTTIQFYNPYVLNTINPLRMLIGTNNLYESSDQGDTLANLMNVGKPVSSLSYGSRNADGTSAPDAFYVGTAGAGAPLLLHRATAGGAITTLAAYPGGGVRDLVMDPQNLRRVFVLDEQNRVWGSFDEGVTWVNLTANLGSLLTQARTIELYSPDASVRNMVLMVGGQGGVIQLRRPGAAGVAWTRLGTGLPNGRVYDLRYNYARDVLVAGFLGRGAWTLTGFFRGGAAALAAPARPLVTKPLALPKDTHSTPPSSRAAPRPGK